MEENKQLSQTEYLAQLQEKLGEFEKSLEGKEMEELEAIEKKLIEEIDESEKNVSEKEFDIEPSSYKKVAKGVRQLLEKKTFSWREALAMKALFGYWSQTPAPKTIPFPVIDATLNTCGSVELKGKAEADISLSIQKFIEPLRKEYTDLRADSYILSEKHNILLKKMSLMRPVPAQDAE